MNTEKELTGYPSIDKPWLKYYREGAEERANDIPKNKTVWDVIKEKLIEDINIPAIEYFGRTISRKEFIDLVFTWTKVFKQMGILPDEVIPVYSPFFPDICAMVFALNSIGACPYFLKLSISPADLAKETVESRFAIIFDEMWSNVNCEFTKDKYEKIIIVTALDGMSSPKKQILSCLSKFSRSKNRVPKQNNIYSIKQVKRSASEYSGSLNEPFVPNRSAFITSSSGTTVDGIVKGTVATNESTISQLYMANESDIQFFKGDRCLNHFPPTASTSLNILFFLALYKGLTVIIDPRVSENDFYNQIIKKKPNIALTTGSSWEAFFNRVHQEMMQGKTFDFHYAKGWTIGGEGTDVKKYAKWNKIMKEAHATNLMFSGYGSSELFSGICVEKTNARYNCDKQIMSVGIPYAGITMGVFDKDGNELQYGKRGELRVKSRSAMKEYYNNPNLTVHTKVNGWIHTGDLAEIDEDGFVYIWGRTSDTVASSDGREIYLFDVANSIKAYSYIKDAIVLTAPVHGKNIYLVAHIVWSEEYDPLQKARYIEELNEVLRKTLPSNITLVGYAEHKNILPYSTTTLKKDKNRLSHQVDGFVQSVNGELKEIDCLNTMR